jgi:STIP1 family protein 1
MVIPDHLICKITYDMMEDPVTNSVGQTYEREVIEEHIKKNGLIDPLTREPIK